MGRSRVSYGRCLHLAGHFDGAPFLASLSGDYNAGTTQAFGEFGYGTRARNFAFEPCANLAYVSLHTDGFTGRAGRLH